MAKFKKNIVRPNIFDYNLAIFGQAGTGKTTLAYKVCRKLLGDNYVIFNCGKEDGIKALPDAIYYDCPTWSDLEEIVDDICENRDSEDYKDLKVIVLDTIDEIFEMAQNEVIRLSIKNDGKRITSINAAFSGYGAGLAKTEELVLDTLWKLKSVGINVFYIGHTKNRTCQDVINDTEYDILTSNLSNRYFSTIANKMDVIGICYVDRDVIKSKSNLKDIKGKTIERNVITSEARKICFRSDDFVTSSKSRFPDIQGIIDLDADQFIEAIEGAIQSLIDKSNMSKEQIEEHYEKENEEKKQKAIEENKLAEVVTQIVDFVKANVKDKASYAPIMEKCKELGYADPSKLDNLKDAKAVLVTIKK